MRIFALVCCTCCLFFLCVVGSVSAAPATDPSTSESTPPSGDVSLLAVDLSIVDSGYYATWSVSCQLGDIHLSLPESFPSSSLVLSGGRLINMTDSTLYLYCSEFPSYVFSANRFGPVSYREANGAGYQTVELIVSDATVFRETMPLVLFFLLLLSALLTAVVIFVKR